MITRITRLAFLSGCLFSGALSFGQSTEPVAKQEDEFAVKTKETKLQEVITTDSLGPETLMKRAVWWIKQESPRYRKTAGTTTGSKAECIASFPVKPKQLNPEVDYTGKITMKAALLMTSTLGTISPTSPVTTGTPVRVAANPMGSAEPSVIRSRSLARPIVFPFKSARLWTGPSAGIQATG